MIGERASFVSSPTELEPPLRLQSEMLCARLPTTGSPGDSKALLACQERKVRKKLDSVVNSCH